MHSLLGKKCAEPRVLHVLMMINRTPCCSGQQLSHKMILREVYVQHSCGCGLHDEATPILSEDGREREKNLESNFHPIFGERGRDFSCAATGTLALQISKCFSFVLLLLHSRI